MAKKTLISKSLVGLTFTAKQRRQACLVQFSGNNIGRPYFLEQKETSIGRDPRCSIHVPEQKVSTRHALVIRGAAAITLHDMESTNGVYINGRRCRGATRLKDGDMVMIGKTNFKFFRAGNVEQLFYEKVYRIATIDEKTQVFNDKYLMSRLKAESEVAMSTRQPLSLILYDLDFFKKVNDHFGHMFGDVVLKGTARAASETIRKNDVLCRYGGEEFAVILPGTDLRTAIHLAQRLCRAIAQTPFVFEHMGKKVQCVQTASLGVCPWHPNWASPKAFLKEVDKKLYRAKSAGRNCVVG